LTKADNALGSGLDQVLVAHRIGDPCPMGALPRPEVPPGPHRELVGVLHDLHHRAGWPSLRRLAEQTGVSHTTVSKALSSATLPRWGTVELLVEAMGGDVAQVRELWLAASTPSAGPGTALGASRCSRAWRLLPRRARDLPVPTAACRPHRRR
jgi:transcriptional regulator with XRE-family HTH domain